MENIEQMCINDQPLTDPERFVLGQVMRGEEADLGVEYGPDPRAREVRTSFLEVLLTSGFTGVTVHRRGVNILNAVFSEPLDLEHAQVSCQVCLNGSIFKETADFRDAHFARHLFISGAYFAKKADFHRIKIVISFHCRRTVFRAAVDFLGANIGGQFSATAAWFENIKLTANFDSMKVRHSAGFSNAIFKGPVNFVAAEIGGDFNATGAHFTNETQAVLFDGIHFASYAFFSKTIFKGPVSFFGIWVGKGLSFRPIEAGSEKKKTELAEFHNTVRFSGSKVGWQFNAREALFKGKADFNSIEVGQHIVLDKAIFQGEVEFTAANIVGQFLARGTQFSSPDQTASFNSMKVGKVALFNEASFQGPVNFVWADIGESFEAKCAQFLNQSETASFNSMKVAQGAIFRDAVFMGPTQFDWAEIGGNLEAQGAQFLHEKVLASFNSIKVGEAAFFDEANFQGAAKFVWADIGAQFSARSACFENQQTASFEGLKVGREVIFQDTDFKGGASLNYAEVLDLFIEQGDLPSLKLECAQVKRELRIRAVEITSLQAANLQVRGPTTLERVHILKTADLRDSSFMPLYLIDAQWPKDAGEVRLDGLTYTAISTRSDPRLQQDWGRLLKWVEGSRFNQQNYAQLEAYYQRGGQKNRADKIFIRCKQLELALISDLIGKGLKWRKGIKSILINLLKLVVVTLKRFFWGLLTGYGRQPGRTLLPILFLIILGVFIFNPNYLEPKLSFFSTNWYESLGIRFFLSLDRFLPGVDLGIAKLWQPHNIGDWLYFHFHKICGWILIPIGIGALYSSMKK